MKTELLPQAKRPATSKLFWVAGGVLALSLTRIAFSVPDANGSDSARAALATAPAVIELNRIDHSQIDWDKHPATSEAAGISVAAYGFGT